MKLILVTLLVVAALMLAVSIARAQSAETLVVDAPSTVTACELESSADNGTTWTILTPRVTPGGTPRQCTFTVTTPATGRTLYRWAHISGTTRTLRTDAGVYLCVGLADCPFVPSNVGVR